MPTTITKSTSVVVVPNNPDSAEIGRRLSFDWQELNKEVNAVTDKIKNLHRLNRPEFNVHFEQHLLLIQNEATLPDHIPPNQKHDTFRIVVGGDATQQLKPLSNFTREEKRRLQDLAPITLVEIVADNSGIRLFEPPPGVAVAIRCSWDQLKVRNLLRDLAVEIFCCVYFTGPFVVADNTKKKRKLLDQLTREKVAFAEIQNLTFRNNPALPTGSSYFPFVLATHDQTDQLDLNRFVATWVAFQQHIIQNHRLYNEPIFRVGSVDAVMQCIATDRKFHKLRGLVSHSRLQAEITNSFQSYGIGDYVLLIAKRSPTRKDKRESMTKKVNERSTKWKGYRVGFERFHRDGYSEIRAYVDVFRFRLV